MGDKIPAWIKIVIFIMVFPFLLYIFGIIPRTNSSALFCVNCIFLAIVIIFAKEISLDKIISELMKDLLNVNPPKKYKVF